MALSQNHVAEMVILLILKQTPLDLLSYDLIKPNATFSEKRQM